LTGLRRAVLLLALLAAVTGSAVTGGASAAAPKTSLPEIEDEVMCPICKTLLSLSASPAAQRERAFIRKLIARGMTKDEIKQALVAEYGGQVLAEPDQPGITLWAYAVPIALIVVAALGLIWSLLRRRRGPPDEPDEKDDGFGAGPDNDDDERLRRDMARFDL